MAHRKRWPVLIRPVRFHSSVCVGAAVSSSETGRRDTWQSIPKNCIYELYRKRFDLLFQFPVFVRLTFRRFFIGQTSREHRSRFFWTTRFDYPILYSLPFRILESTFTREFSFSSLVFYFSSRFTPFEELFRNTNVSILF